MPITGTIEMLNPDHNLKPALYPGQADPRPLRDDHFLCLVMDCVLAVRAAIRRWSDRRHTRQVLAALDEHQLHDIGLSRAMTRLAYTNRQVTPHAGEHQHRPAA